MYTIQGGKTDKEIEEEIRKILIQGGKLVYSWDCGGDEALVTFSGDTKAKEILDKNELLNDSIEVYLMNLLNLPDAGEFAMEGRGNFFIVDKEIIFTYESIMKGYEGYDSETYESTGWQEINEIEPQFTGLKKPFK